MQKQPIRMLKYCMAILIAGCITLSATAQTPPGYVQNETIKVSGVTTEAGVINLPDAQKITTRSFTDGLGRTIQTVNMQASPLGRDMVQPVLYDNLGQTAKSYLPYTAITSNGGYQANALSGQTYFYANSPKVANDDSLYSRQVFENSPLQRVLRAGSVGSGFGPANGQHYKTINYRTNTLTDAVITWSTAGVNTGTYAAGTLQVLDATDEDGARVLAFTNNGGQTVLKKELKDEVAGTYLSTYYIYNEAGTLRNTVPPKAVSLMQVSGNWSLAQTDIANLIFSYQYDNKGRTVQKTLPGGIVVYMVYDPLDRPVLVQDNNLRVGNRWNYIKYDGRDNPISQGIYMDATRIGLSAMQSYVSGLNYNTTWFETRNTTSGTGYYSNSVFPTTSIAPLAYTYYDNYELNGNGTPDYSYQVQGLSGEATPTSQLRGMPTMIRSRTIGQGLANIWLIRVMFYDKNGRAIQVRSNNQLNSTVADVQTNVPDFTGAIQQAKVTKVTAATTTVLTTFGYDHVYRPLTIDQSYNGGATLRIAAYEYNELGQLVKKNLKQVNPNNYSSNLTLGTANSVASGQTSNQFALNSITLTPDFTAVSGSTFTADIAMNYLQAVDYRYNIRGQMVNINNSKLINDNGITNNDDNDVFGMDLLYNQVDANLNNTPSFSGRQTAVKWMTRDAGGVKTNERAYRYHYDVLNRLYLGYYAERAGSSTGAYNINSNGFNEADISYDDNGNILALRRNSSTPGGSVQTQVDDLTYTYDASNPNRLKKVTDGVGANYTSYGFRNLTGSTADYSYDNSGNLITDPYKGLTISYNELNRANQVTITTAINRYIRHTYNSAGQLIRKQTYENAVLQKTTDYIDGFVYENSTLAYFAIPEGRVINSGSTLVPEFVITDQQGNARISFKDNGSGQALVTQENSYYAFGLTFASSPVATPTLPNKNLYNGGSEWQNDFSNLPDYYNTFFRNYDQALGRFVSLDPLAEAAESLTGYNYSGNNPVMFNDPLGDVITANRWLDRYVEANKPGDGREWDADATSTLYDRMEAENAGRYGPDMGFYEALRNARAMGATLVYYKGGPGTYGDMDFARVAVSDYNNYRSTISEAYRNITNTGPGDDDIKVSGSYGLNGYEFTVNGTKLDHGILGTNNREAFGHNPYMFSKAEVDRAVKFQASLVGAEFGGFFLGKAIGWIGGRLASEAAVEGTHVVYQGLDKSGVVRYVGITGRDASIRFAEHLNSFGTGKEFLQYRVIDGAEGLSPMGARIWEQTLINSYGLGKNGLLLNKINSIAPKYWGLYGL